MGCTYGYCRFNKKGRCYFRGKDYGYTDCCPAESLSLVDRMSERGFATMSELRKYQLLHDAAPTEMSGGYE